MGGGDELSLSSSPSRYEWERRIQSVLHFLNFFTTLVVAQYPEP